MEEDRGTVCVTGATGYVGSWLILRLLQLGYLVRATIRRHHLAADISYLTNLPQASKKLQFFEADLEEPDSFDAAIQGCIGVFHVAHPLDKDNKELENTVTKRAVDGTLGILKACLNSKTVKRVVYTSSSATILYNNKGLTELDESTWIDLENFQRNKIATSSSYLVSKTLTEKVALEFAQKNGLEVVSLVLSLVVGPFICPKVPSSVSDALPMIGVERQYENNSNFWLVHIDDVTRALIYLLHYPDAEGRYICSSTHITVSQFHEFLHARYPEFQIIMPIVLKETKRVTISSKKLLETGFKYKYGLNEMFDGAIQSCRDKGFL